jgi:hypothetical protein
MLTLRLTQTSKGKDSYQVQANLAGEAFTPLTSTFSFSFGISEQDQEDLRWYFEDYLNYPFDPAPTIASRIERRLLEIGENLFHSVFLVNQDARKLWEELRHRLSTTRIEVVTQNREITNLPWELLFEPEAGVYLALQCQSFVRNVSNVPGNSERLQTFSVSSPKVHSSQLSPAASTNRPDLTEPGSSPIRILLVISRPSDSGAVPFRSIANRLLKSLHAQLELDLDVLRPPTFAQLSDQLIKAQSEGRPYRAIHFDGHGIYEDLQATVMGQPPKKRRGYLLFESADDHKNEPIHGALLGKVMGQARVPLLVLNASRTGKGRDRKPRARLWFAGAGSGGSGRACRGRHALQRLCSHGREVHD